MLFCKSLVLYVSPSNTSTSKLFAISFRPNQYHAELVMQAGGEIVNQYKDFGLVYAKLPVLSIEKLRRNIDIDFVEEDGKFAISNTDQIGNHSSKSQTMISSVIANYDTNSWWLKDVGVKAVHDANDTGLGIKIAILDTGIDYKHPDLAPNYK